MSAARDREHDPFIPWYVEDTPGWLELSLAARGAMEGIARKLNPRTGKLHLRRGLSGLAVLLHVSWQELEPAITELIAKGKVVWSDETADLSDPDHSERKRRGSTERTADWRAKKKAPVTDVTSLPSQASHASPVTPVTSPLISSDLISSDLGSEIASPTGPPGWFEDAVGVVAMTCGVELHVGETWLAYEGHRATKGIAATKPDAQYWLTRVYVPEARETLRRAAREKDRDAKYDRDKRFAKEGPDKPPPPTKAQSMAMAEQLAARIRASKAAAGGAR